MGTTSSSHPTVACGPPSFFSCNLVPSLLHIQQTDKHEAPSAHQRLLHVFGRADFRRSRKQRPTRGILTFAKQEQIVKHYVLLHRPSHSATTVVEVFHEPSQAISRARQAADSACINPECYEETVAAGKEVFRATYGVEGECFLVQRVTSRLHHAEEGAPPSSPQLPEKAKLWLLATLADLLDGEWDLVDYLVEREVVEREVPGSPFLGKFPGPGLFYSLHLRQQEAARALLDVSEDDRTRVREALKDQD